MNRDRILYYKKGYKYQTTRDYHLKFEVVPYAPIDTGLIRMDMQGNTIINKAYAWNGASGPTIDTDSSMIGSLGHDVGYQLIRLGLVDPKYKEYFDQWLHDTCTEDGMLEFRADYWQWAVGEFGGSSCRPSGEPIELMAP
jgi:hypothetical protein